MRHGVLFQDGCDEEGAPADVDLGSFGWPCPTGGGAAVHDIQGIAQIQCLLAYARTQPRLTDPFWAGDAAAWFAHILRVALPLSSQGNVVAQDHVGLTRTAWLFGRQVLQAAEGQSETMRGMLSSLVRALAVVPVVSRYEERPPELSEFASTDFPWGGVLVDWVMIQTPPGVTPLYLYVVLITLS